MEARQSRKDRIQAVIDMGSGIPGMIWGKLTLLREEAGLDAPTQQPRPPGIAGSNSWGSQFPHLQNVVMITKNMLDLRMLSQVVLMGGRSNSKICFNLSSNILWRDWPGCREKSLVNWFHGSWWSSWGIIWNQRAKERAMWLWKWL